MPQSKKEQGSILILTMVVMILVAALSGSLLFITKYHSDTTRMYRDRTMARYYAKGGLSIAMVAMNRDESTQRVEGKIGEWKSVIYLNGSGQWRTLSDGKSYDPLVSDPSAVQVYNERERPLTKRPSKHFRVMLSPNIENAGDPQEAFIALCCTFYDRAPYGIRGFLHRDVSSNRLPGITGYKSIYVKESSVVDSYNSKLGGYAEAVVDGSGNEVVNMNEAGSLGSNGDITITGVLDPMIYGDVNPGPNSTILGDPSLVLDTASTAPRTTELPLPSELDTEWLNEPTEEDLRVGANLKVATKITESGHYQKMTLQSEIIIDGDVKLYCHTDFTANADGKITLAPGAKLALYINGSFTYNGTFSCTDNDPQNFLIKLTHDDRNVEPDPLMGTGYSARINGASALYAVVDAPWTNIQLTGGSDVYGSVIGYNVLLGGNGDGPLPHQAKVHYDENLGNIISYNYDYFVHTAINGPFVDLP